MNIKEYVEKYTLGGTYLLDLGSLRKLIRDLVEVVSLPECLVIIPFMTNYYIKIRTECEEYSYVFSNDLTDKEHNDDKEKLINYFWNYRYTDIINRPEVEHNGLNIHKLVDITNPKPGTSKLEFDKALLMYEQYLFEKLVPHLYKE